MQINGTIKQYSDKPIRWWLTPRGMSAKANVHRGADGKMTLIGPNDPRFFDIYNQPNLSVGDFLNQMKLSVVNDEKIAGNTSDREHVMGLIDTLIQRVTLSGGIDQPFRAGF